VDLSVQSPNHIVSYRFLHSRDPVAQDGVHLVFIELNTRRVHLAGCMSESTSAWVTQQAHQFVWILQDCSSPPRFLTHNRDAKFSTAFDAVFASVGIDIILTPFRAPNANAYAERWIRTCGETAPPLM